LCRKPKLPICPKKKECKYPKYESEYDCYAKKYDCYDYDKDLDLDYGYGCRKYDDVYKPKPQRKCRRSEPYRKPSRRPLACGCDYCNQRRESKGYPLWDKPTQRRS
jgi:hypothetical protein